MLPVPTKLLSEGSLGTVLFGAPMQKPQTWARMPLQALGTVTLMVSELRSTGVLRMPCLRSGATSNLFYLNSATL